MVLEVFFQVKPTTEVVQDFGASVSPVSISQSRANFLGILVKEDLRLGIQ